MGYHRELRQASLTNRLLRAAVAREQRAPTLTTGEDERIKAIETFEQLSRSERWAFLVNAQPALHKLEADVRDGRFGEVTPPDDLLRRRGKREYVTVDGERRVRVTLSSSDPPYTPEETQLLTELAHATMRLTRELQALIGPRSGQHDPVLASQQAFDTAERHLRRPPAKETAISEATLT
jgi:hypothetical protein